MFIKTKSDKNEALISSVLIFGIPTGPVIKKIDETRFSAEKTNFLPVIYYNIYILPYITIFYLIIIIFIKRKLNIF